MPDENNDNAALDRLTPEARERVEAILAVGKARATIHRILNDAVDRAGPRSSFEDVCRRLNLDPEEIGRRAREQRAP